MAMAIPLVVGGVELLWAALGLAAAASAAVLISNSDLPAKVFYLKYKSSLLLIFL